MGLSTFGYTGPRVDGIDEEINEINERNERNEIDEINEEIQKGEPPIDEVGLSDEMRASIKESEEFMANQSLKDVNKSRK